MESEPARDALAAFREATRCSAELRDDNLRAIEARLHGAVPLRRPSTVRRTAIVMVAALAAAAVAVWIAGDLSNATIAVRDDDPRSQAIDAAQRDDDARPISDDVARPPVMIPEPPTPEVIAAARPLRSSPPTQRSTPTPEWTPPPEPTGVPPMDDGLAREVQLLSTFSREVDARHPSGARRALDTLLREFPDGALVDERWAVEVRMHCSEHAADAAATTAAAFLRARPQSSLARELVARPCPAPKSR